MFKQLRLLTFSLGALALCAAAPASAQTMSFADAADALVAACGKDIETHCSKINLGGGRMKACLSGPKVSAGCKAAMPKIFAGLQQRAQARVDVLKMCDRDAARLCQGVQKGDGQLLECMLLARKGASASCNQAITDAGYR
jgi:hypothetical protein